MTISLPRRIRRSAAATPQNAAEGVKFHLGEIAKLFDRPKLTLVIRSVVIDGDIVVGNDDIELAIKAMQQGIKEYGKTALIPLDS